MGPELDAATACLEAVTAIHPDPQSFLRDHFQDPELLVEMAIFLIGVFLYASVTQAKNGVGRWALWILVLLFLTMCLLIVGWMFKTGYRLKQ